jgi:hypothetical protein
MAGRPAGGPPGLGPACGPPSEPPPPAPPGLFLGGEKQAEISGTIQAQVHRRLEMARHDTENKVKQELKQIRDVMIQMDVRLDQLIGQLDGVEPRADPPLDADHIGQTLSKIEQTWGQEIRTLKEELHQTILAHNHNADLIKHHKDTIDSLRERCHRLQSSGPRGGAEAQQQLGRLEQLSRQQQQTTQKITPLFERLTALERSVTTVAARSAWRYPMSPMMPGVRPGLGVNPAMMAGMGAGLLPGKGAGMRPPFGQGKGVGAPPLPTEEMLAAAAAAVAMPPGVGLDVGEDEDVGIAGLAPEA